MTPGLKRNVNVIMLLVLLLLIAVAFAIRSRTNTANTEAAPIPAPLAALPVPNQVAGPPTEGPVTPYPRMPGYGTPPALPADVPPVMTPVPAGSDSTFGDDKTPISGYTPVPTHQPSDPVSVSVTYDFFWPDTNREATSAVTIITGTVTQIGAPRWTTANGLRPANPWAVGITDTIVTPVFISVSTYLKAPQLATVMLVEAVGGIVGADQIEWSGDNLQTYTVGDRVVVFLDKRGVDPNLLVSGYPPWHMLEHYTLTSNGNATNTYRTTSAQQLFDEITTALK